MDPSLEEDLLSTRFGADAFILEFVRKLNHELFPKAGVDLYIRDGKAYAVTAEPENALVVVATLRTLKGMSDAEVISLVQRVVAAYRERTRSKKPLAVLRVQAQFLTQDDLAAYINAKHGSPPAKAVISTKTIWSAENGRSISQTSALLIIAALKERGVVVETNEIDWVIGHQGKRPPRGERGT